MLSEVTVIIPNWNGAVRLERLFESLRGQTMAPARVLVVDNGSEDSSREVATAWGAEVLPLNRNFGFARAVNEGAAAAATKWIAILNNDVMLAPDCLERLVEAAESSNSGFAVPKILSMRRSSMLDGSFDLLARSGCAWRAGHGAPDGPAFQRSRTISFAPFTVCLVKREVFASLGGLDERFESYLEDVDFGLRCSLEGVSGIYSPDALASHEGSATLGAWSSRMVRLISRNQVLLAAKHLSMKHLWPIVIGQLLWGALALKRGHFGAWCAGKLDGLRGWRAVRSESGRRTESIDRILRESESQIRNLQSDVGMDAYWRSYFFLAP